MSLNDAKASVRDTLSNTVSACRLMSVVVPDNALRRQERRCHHRVTLGLWAPLPRAEFFAVTRFASVGSTVCRPNPVFCVD